MKPYLTNFIFPRPNKDYRLYNKYKNNIIHIPTQRKVQNKEEFEKIPCFFQKNPNSNNILIIFHCNGVDMFNLSSIIKQLSEKYNINILIPEYPGYSIYYAPCSSEICLENTLIIYDFLLKNIKNITEKNIYVLGRSLGTGPAVYLSSKRSPAGTFLISPYTTFGAVGKHKEENFKILSNHFRSIDYVDKIKTPILIIHGKVDPLIDYHESIQLYEKCQKDIKKAFELIDDMAHNYGYKVLFNDIIPNIINFVDKNCPLNNSQDNNIIIDFDQELYELPEELKKTLSLWEFW